MWFLTMPTTRSRSAFASFSRRQIVVGHLGADVLVLEEAVLAGRALARLARARLADVVQQRAQPPDRVARRVVDDVQRVLEDVVLVEPVLRAADALEQLRDHLAEQAGRAHQLQAARRLRRRQHLEQLVADPLGRHLAKHVQRRLDRRLRRRIDVERQLRRLAHGAHRAQAVLAKARDRIADRADQPPRQIAAAVERIGDRVGQRIVGDRVHREVAARQILRQRLHVGHRRRPAAVEVRRPRRGRSSPRRGAAARCRSAP